MDKGGTIDLEGLIKAGTLMGVSHIETNTGMKGLGELITPFISGVMRDAKIPTSLEIDPGVWALGKFVWSQYENNQLRIAGAKNVRESKNTP